MTKPGEKTREELTAEIEESKKKIRQYKNGMLEKSMGASCQMI